MSANIDTVRTYLDGFNTSDHEKILGCLTDDIVWTVYGAYRIEGKAAYDENIESPGFIGPPRIEIVRLVEQDDTVMAELAADVTRETGETMRLSMAELFVMRGGLICERRAWVIALKENDFR